MAISALMTDSQADRAMSYAETGMTTSEKASISDRNCLLKFIFVFNFSSFLTLTSNATTRLDSPRSEDCAANVNDAMRIGRIEPFDGKSHDRLSPSSRAGAFCQPRLWKHGGHSTVTIWSPRHRFVAHV